MLVHGRVFTSLLVPTGYGSDLHVWDWKTKNQSILCVQGFNPLLVPTSYGSDLHVWDWKARKQIQKLELGTEGLIPLELRFLHNPDSCHGFVGAALASNVIHFTKVLAFMLRPQSCCHT